MNDSYFNDISLWLHGQPEWILLATALLAFLESLALVGIVIPGVALLFGAALAAGASDVVLWQVLAAAFLGAVLGDGISFFLGRHFHSNIVQLPPFKNHPEWITRGENFFQRYGLISVVIGRFVGPLRPVMPLVAGMMEMAPSRFLLVNGISALGWAPMYILPGYLVGIAADPASSFNHRHLIFVISLIIAGWFLGQLVWGYKAKLLPRRQLKMATLFTMSLMVLLFSSTYLFVIHSEWLPELNTSTAMYLQALRHEGLDWLFISITSVGYKYPMWVWGLTITLALLLDKNYWLASAWVGTTVLSQGLIFGLKNFFQVARPELVFEPPGSYAFPSGHASISVIFLSLLMIMALPRITFKWQKAWVSFASVVVVLACASRLYLGVHWLSDVVAGLFLGVFVGCGFYLCFLFKPFRAPNPWHLLLASIVALTFDGLVLIMPDWDLITRHYQPLTSGLAY